LSNPQACVTLFAGLEDPCATKIICHQAADVSNASGVCRCSRVNLSVTIASAMTESLQSGAVAIAHQCVQNQNTTHLILQFYINLLVLPVLSNGSTIKPMIVNTVVAHVVATVSL